MRCEKNKIKAIKIKIIHLLKVIIKVWVIVNKSNSLAISETTINKL